MLSRLCDCHLPEHCRAPSPPGPTRAPCPFLQYPPPGRTTGSLCLSPCRRHLPWVIRVGGAGCMGARSHALDGDGETGVVPAPRHQHRAPQGLRGVGAPRPASTPGSWVGGGPSPGQRQARTVWPFPTRRTGQRLVPARPLGA